MKSTTIIISIIIGLILLAQPILYLYKECIIYFEKREFLEKYEFEDFSKFKNVSLFIRDSDIERNPIVFVYAPHLVRDTSQVRCYVIIINKKNGKIIRTKWTTENNVNADTIKLQQLAQTFIQYKIPRLQVDEKGNVFVYLKDVETLALVKLVNANGLQKRSQEIKWIKVRDKWYKPKHS